jgi:hypothetical protein
MPRTQSRLDMDTPCQDGHIFVPVYPTNVAVLGTSGVVTYPLGGSGLVTFHLASATTVSKLLIPLSATLARYGVADDLQEQFGAGAGFLGAGGQAVGSPYTYGTSTINAGTAVSIAVQSSVGFTAGNYVVIDTVASGVQETQLIISIPDGTHIQVATVKSTHTATFPVAMGAFTTPAGVTGRPPFTGATQLTPVSSARPKGIAFKAIYPVYTLTTAAQTSQAISLTKTTFANNTAPVVANIITAGQNGLANATQAQPYLTCIPVPVANQGFQTTRFTEFLIEWDLTPSGGTAVVDIYGIFIDLAYNFN